MCEEYELLMSRGLDGDLSPEENAALREHMESCPSCRAAYEALSHVSELLGAELPDPPETLAASVMDRIAAYPNAPKRRGPWKKALVAACLVLVIGVGGVSALVSTHRAASDAAKTETVETVEEYAAMSAPVPEAEYDNGTPMLAAGAPEEACEPAADAAVEQAALRGDTDLDGWPYTVPAGREADFEELLQDAHSTPSEDREILAYVEYRGVIYEFSADGDALVWRDAAEGFPVTSPASIDALWDILG